MYAIYRQEKKYLMTIENAKRLSTYLDKIMQADSHGDVDGYIVRSLYFDTLYDSDFYDKLSGIELRRKLRLRIYDLSSDDVFFEMKQKEGMYQKKRTLQIKKADAVELAKGNYSSLMTYDDSFAHECYGLMNCRVYRPKTIVEYKRKAYTAKENKTRITIDYDIRATESSYDLFSKELNLYPVFDSFKAVLEIKYDGFLLSYIKDIIQMVNKSEISVSKYCLARGILKK